MCVCSPLVCHMVVLFVFIVNSFNCVLKKGHCRRFCLHLKPAPPLISTAFSKPLFGFKMNQVCNVKPQCLMVPDVFFSLQKDNITLLKYVNNSPDDCAVSKSSSSRVNHRMATAASAKTAEAQRDAVIYSFTWPLFNSASNQTSMITLFLTYSRPEKPLPRTAVCTQLQRYFTQIFSAYNRRHLREAIQLLPPARDRKKKMIKHPELVQLVLYHQPVKREDRRLKEQIWNPCWFQHLFPKPLFHNNETRKPWNDSCVGETRSTGIYRNSYTSS